MKHFTMGELCASTTADTHGIKNTPPLQEAGNLTCSTPCASGTATLSM